MTSIGDQPGPAADAGSATRAWKLPMTGRDTAEPHRSSTPLELLFDLTFVVAVGRVAAELAHSIAADQPWHGLASYLMVFFAIWWAWVNFTWFASAFDTDDVGYRLLTLVQMAGVLVLAASVPTAFEHNELTGVVIGYVIMRIALVAQWLRAAAQDPAHRRIALRYARGVTVLQICWVLRLLLPDGPGNAVFLVLVVLEMLVPAWAERCETTSWHPGHIAERHGLFTLIVLGESVLAASNALAVAHAEDGSLAAMVLLGAGGLLLLFALWWLYYLRDPAELLGAQRNAVSFRWGYGHYGIFGALAAIGAGLDVTAEAVAGPVEAPRLLVSYAVAVPICCYLLLLWFLHRPLAERPCPPLVGVLAASAGTLLIAGCAEIAPLAAVVAALCLPAAGLVGFSVWRLAGVDRRYG